MPSQPQRSEKLSADKGTQPHRDHKASLSARSNYNAVIDVEAARRRDREDKREVE